MVVKQIADSESIAPTEAANQASVMENCQGWAIHVIARLVECHPIMKWEMANSMTLDTVDIQFFPDHLDKACHLASIFLLSRSCNWLV